MNTDVSTSAPAAPVKPALPSAATPLPDDPVVLRHMIRELLDTLHSTQRERDGLRERINLLLQKLYGRKSERFDPNQPLLFPDLNDAPDSSDTPVSLAPDQQPAAPDAPPDVPPSMGPAKRKGHGRKTLPKNRR